MLQLVLGVHASFTSIQNRRLPWNEVY